MKKPLLIGVSALALLTLSATLFAQTTTGTSLITEMKAAVRSFTLAADLNPGVTDLKSGPVSGKKTGDMLTAEEYNRILELVGQGGGGGKFEINDSTTKTVYQITYNPTDGWSKSSPTPTTTICPAYWTECKIIDTAAHDFCNITSVAGTAPHASLTYLGAKKYRLTNSYTNTPSLAPYSSGITVTCYDNIGTGGGGSTGGGAGWVNVPLTDTADFDVLCLYRFMPTTGPVAGQLMRYSGGVQSDRLFFGFNMNPGWIGGWIDKGAKAAFGTNSNGTFVVGKLEKLCAGSGSGGGGGFNWDQCTTEWVGTPRDGTSYTNPAGLKCKYTGNGLGATNSLADANMYYLCCPGA